MQGAVPEAARHACPNRLDFARLLPRADEVLGRPAAARSPVRFAPGPVRPAATRFGPDRTVSTGVANLADGRSNAGGLAQSPAPLN
jgi:hypothetical protein